MREEIHHAFASVHDSGPPRSWRLLAHRPAERQVSLRFRKATGRRAKIVSPRSETTGRPPYERRSRGRALGQGERRSCHPAGQWPGSLQQGWLEAMPDRAPADLEAEGGKERADSLARKSRSHITASRRGIGVSRHAFISSFTIKAYVDLL